MKWRVTASEADLGSVILSEPEGLAQCLIGLTRHPDWHSLVKEFKSAFGLYGSNGTQDGKRDWIKNVESVKGPDAVINLLVELSEDGYTYTTLFDGEAGVQTISEYLDPELGHILEITPVQKGFWRKAVSRYDVPVDVQSSLNLDGDAVTVYSPELVNLTPQIINVTTSFNGHAGLSDTLIDCYLATTTNITLSGLQTIDGILTEEGMRVFVINQTDPKENGPYNASVGVWTRTSDANTSPELEVAVGKVTNGSVYAGKSFVQITTPFVLGTDDAVFIETDYVTTDIASNPAILFSIIIILSPGFGFIGPGIDRYAQFCLGKSIDEIKDTFDLGSDVFMDVIDIVNIVELTDVGGDLTIIGNPSFRFYFTVNYKSNASPYSNYFDTFSSFVRIFYQVNDDSPVFIASDIQGKDPGDYDTPGVFHTITQLMDIQTVPINITIPGLLPSDLVKVYAQYTMQGAMHFSAGGRDIEIFPAKVMGGVLNSDLQFILKSTFPKTQVNGFLIHDLIASTLDRTTDSDKFYSPLLGSDRTRARTYLDNGFYWNNIAFKGVNLRGYSLSEKIFSVSLKNIWEGLDPVLSLGMSYEKIGGVDRIVIKQKKDYYNSSSMSVLLSGVQRIKRKYGNEYYNSIQVGNDKGKTEDISGIDDIQTETRASVLKNIGQSIKILSTWITQSLTFEQARRTTKTKSSDYQFDNENFLLEVTYEGGTYKPRLDEDYTLVTGLLNEETRFNKRYFPARALLRWLPFLQGGLQKYIGSVLKFVSGDGNYGIVSQRIDSGAPDDYGGLALSENADISVTTEHLFIPQTFEIEHYLTMEEFNLIDASRDFAIGVSQSYVSGSHKEFFIDDLQFEPNTGQIKLIGKFKDTFDIVTVPPGGQIFQGGKIFDAFFDYTFE